MEAGAHDGPEVGEGVKRKERGGGSASDGREVFTVAAHNPTWSMPTGRRFAFIGMGLTGTLGKQWEMVTVTSALQF